MVIILNISILLGGIILFIHAIDTLTNDLLKMSLNKVKEKLKKFTSSFKSSLLTGFISTSIIQSSSALIMLTIALINANLLTFNQSIGIILGSNIATTITSFIIGLNVEKYSSIIMLISLIFINHKNEKIKKISKLFFSIGLLFFSIFLMSESSNQLANTPQIYTFINKVSNNFILSIIVGTLLTTALQSSSVFIAIIQILALSGFISINQAIPLIFGANIGTSFDPLFTIFSCNRESKKLAHFSIFFNISTVIIFSILIKPFTFILTTLGTILHVNIAIEIALINILFNLLGVLLVIPFIDKIKRYYAKW